MITIENFGNGLHRVVYISRISNDLVSDIDAEVERIVAVSQRNNAALAVTGLLLAHGGFFIQALEGDFDTLSGLINRIAHDPRHFDLKVVETELVAQRAFGRWSMRSGRRPGEGAAVGFDPYAMNGKDLTALLTLSAALVGALKR
jgi:hypothetical protein